MDKSSCYRKVLDTYPSLVDATSSCKNDSKCTGIVDVDCENNLFSTCSGEMKFGSTWEMVCFWRKGKIWLPFSTSKDLEILEISFIKQFQYQILLVHSEGSNDDVLEPTHTTANKAPIKHVEKNIQGSLRYRNIISVRKNLNTH